MLRRGRFWQLRETVRAVLEERLARATPSRRLRLAMAEEEIVRNCGRGRLRVLDAGCGDGLLSLALAARHSDWELVGMELREDLVSAATARAEMRSLGNVSFRQADLTKPFPATGFDVAIAVECLAEIPEDRQALAQIAAALRPGGLLVVHVPDRDWKPVLPGSEATWRDEVRHGYELTQLEEMLHQAGLTEVEVTPTYRSLASLAQEVRDRLRPAPLLLRAIFAPLLLAAVALERRGLTWGSPNAMLATARALPDEASAASPAG
jgi:SAM-dependent methyltransferase